MTTTNGRVYLDSCPFIDMAKVAINAPLPAGRDREIVFIRWLLEAAKDREIEIYTSTLTVAECLHAENNIGPEVQRVFTGLLTSGQYVRLVTPDPFVAERARDLRWNHGIVIRGRGADYLHVASALHAGCSEFLTTDGRTDGRGIISQADQLRPLGLAVRLPSQTTILPAHRRQEQLLQPSSAAVVNIRDKRSKK